MRWLRPPRLELLSAEHAVVLADGRTPVRVVATGWGLLRVAGRRRLVRGRLDEVWLVPSETGLVRATIIGLGGRAARALRLRATHALARPALHLRALPNVRAVHMPPVDRTRLRPREDRPSE